VLKSKAKKLVLIRAVDCNLNAEGKMHVLNTLPGRFAKNVLSKADRIFLEDNKQELSLILAPFKSR
jgi:intein-encoded DNA endonuclease-like protein